MNDLSRDVPARPVRNHVLQTSSASNAPHQCGHVDMSEPLGRARIEENTVLPTIFMIYAAVEPQKRASEVMASGTGTLPVPQAETAHSKKPSHLRSWLRHIRRPRPPPRQVTENHLRRAAPNASVFELSPRAGYSLIYSDSRLSQLRF